MRFFLRISPGFPAGCPVLVIFQNFLISKQGWIRECRLLRHFGSKFEALVLGRVGGLAGSAMQVDVCLASGKSCSVATEPEARVLEVCGTTAAEAPFPAARLQRPAAGSMRYSEQGGPQRRRQRRCSGATRKVGVHSGSLCPSCGRRRSACLGASK